MYKELRINITQPRTIAQVHWFVAAYVYAQFLTL